VAHPLTCPDDPQELLGRLHRQCPQAEHLEQGESSPPEVELIGLELHETGLNDMDDVVVIPPVPEGG
jgi:hypothetical protein